MQDSGAVIRPSSNQLKQEILKIMKIKCLHQWIQTGVMGFLILMMVQACSRTETSGSESIGSETADKPVNEAGPIPEPAIDSPSVQTEEIQDQPVLQTEQSVEAEQSYDDQAVQSEYSVVTMTLTQNVQDREPVDSLKKISVKAGHVYTHTAVKSKKAGRIYHIYKFGDTELAKVPLAVGASSAWRTWSSKTLHSAWVGTWTIEVRGENDQLLAVRSLEVTR